MLQSMPLVDPCRQSTVIINTSAYKSMCMYVYIYRARIVIMCVCVCVSCLSTHCGNVGPGFKVADRPLPPQFTYEREKLEAITPSVGVLFYPSKWQIWKRMCKEVFGWAYTITNFTKLCHLQNYRVVYSICLQRCPPFKHHSPHVAKAGVTRTGCLKPQEMGHYSFKSNIIKYG